MITLVPARITQAACYQLWSRKELFPFKKILTNDRNFKSHNVAKYVCTFFNATKFDCDEKLLFSDCDLLNICEILKKDVVDCIHQKY